MGYSTDFDGEFSLNKTLSKEIKEFLTVFSRTRRVKRNVHEIFGIEGEFHTLLDSKLQNNIADDNKPPSTQPGLYCQWKPSEDGNSIRWDGGEKFYNYIEWISYIINKILAPNGYVLNGSVDWYGEDRSDSGTITVKDNRVFVKEKGVKKIEIFPSNSVRVDVPLIFTPEDKLLDSSIKDSTPTKEEVINCIIESVSIRGIDLDDYRHSFEDSSLYESLKELFKK